MHDRKHSFSCTFVRTKTLYFKGSLFNVIQTFISDKAKQVNISLINLKYL